MPIVLDTGRYISNLFKGIYEFEYKWKKEGEFIDSRLKSIPIFSYHDRVPIHISLFPATPFKVSLNQSI